MKVIKTLIILLFLPSVCLGKAGSTNNLATDDLATDALLDATQEETPTISTTPVNDRISAAFDTLKTTGLVKLVRQFPNNPTQAERDMVSWMNEAISGSRAIGKTLKQLNEGNLAEKALFKTAELTIHKIIQYKINDKAASMQVAYYKKGPKTGKMKYTPKDIERYKKTSSLHMVERILTGKATLGDRFKFWAAEKILSTVSKVKSWFTKQPPTEDPPPLTDILIAAAAEAGTNYVKDTGTKFLNDTRETIDHLTQTAVIIGNAGVDAATKAREFTLNNVESAYTAVTNSVVTLENNIDFGWSTNIIDPETGQTERFWTPDQEPDITDPNYKTDMDYAKEGINALGNYIGSTYAYLKSYVTGTATEQDLTSEALETIDSQMDKEVSRQTISHYSPEEMKNSIPEHREDIIKVLQMEGSKIDPSDYMLEEEDGFKNALNDVFEEAVKAATTLEEARDLYRDSLTEQQITDLAKKLVEIDPNGIAKLQLEAKLQAAIGQAELSRLQKQHSDSLEKTGKEDAEIQQEEHDIEEQEDEFVDAQDSFEADTGNTVKQQEDKQKAENAIEQEQKDAQEELLDAQQEQNKEKEEEAQKAEEKVQEEEKAAEDEGFFDAEEEFRGRE